MSMRSYKSCQWHILRTNWYLPVTFSHIQICHEFGISSFIQQVIYSWHRKLIRDCYCIQLPEVNAQPTRTIRLRHYKYWRSPSTIRSLNNLDSNDKVPEHPVQRPSSNKSHFRISSFSSVHH